MTSAIDPLSAQPTDDQFQPLAEYQAATPSTFFGGKPVLHYHNSSCAIQASSADLDASPALEAFVKAGPSDAPTNGTNGDVAPAISDIKISVEAWITSSSILLWSSSAKAGMEIQYPAISIHARQGDGLYIQLVMSDMRHTSDDDIETIELVLTPGGKSTDESSAAASSGAGEGVNGHGPSTEAERLYAAVSACADLHPDPDPDDQEGAADMSALLAAAGGDLEGAGWITAENVHEFQPGPVEVVDERMGVGEGDGPLGPGAGTVRAAEDEAEADGEEEESKWRRTS